MRWPALGPQWFLWSPPWERVLGEVPAQRAVSEGLTWVYGRGEPTSAPPSVVPPGCSALWLRTALDGDLFDALENFLDPMHTPFIHAGLVRSEGVRTPVVVRLHSDGLCASALYRGARRSGLIRRVFGFGIDETEGRFRPPGTVELDYRAAGVLRLRIHLAFTPTTPGRLGLTVGLFSPLPQGVAVLAGVPLGPLLGVALRQDLAILARKSAHEDRWFPERRYTHTDNDLLGPLILQWLRTGTLAPRERDVTVLL
ncbi:MAG: hypothetical protein R3F61_28530 [Myxococcota bacterium]